MRKNIGKRMIAMALMLTALTQSVTMAAAAEDSYSDAKQPLELKAVAFEETGIEVARTSEDARLLTVYNTVRTQYPTLSSDGTKLVLPETGDDNYAVSLYGSSNKAVIDMEGNVTQPLEDMQVYLYYKVVNKQTGEELHMDDPIIVEVNGLYADSQRSINRPQIMPGIREWKGNEGTFTFSGDLVLAEESLADAASVAKDYIEGMTGTAVTVKTGTPASGDIYLAWDASLNVGEEGYVLDIDDILSVTATDYTGIVYAGATITQMLMHGAVPKGLMRDYPQYEVRASMLDVARFYMPMDYLREMTVYSAFFKFNEFHAHINDNNGEQNYAFRVESKKYPEINGGIPADEVYSQEEYRQYQKDMKRYCIDVVTEIDTPAHARFVAAYDASLMLDDTRVDIRKPEAIAFIKSLVDEFLDGDDPVVQSDKFHIGIDEYNYDYSDELRSYTNEICAYISAKGYEPRIWCSNASSAASDIVIDNSITQTVYNHRTADVQELLATEVSMINDHSKYLYVVPVTTNGCNDFIDLEAGYKDWEAGRINRPTDPAMVVLQPGHPLLKGAESTIWYDDNVAASEFDIYSRYVDQVMLIAEKTWYGKKTETSTYEDFMERVELYSDYTPMANPGRYIPSDGNVIASYDFTQSAADLSGNGYDAALTGLSVSGEGLVLDKSGYVTLPFRGIGYPYCVDFTLTVTEAGENAVLFDGRDGTLYLNYDGTGKMGFERKGFRFLFDYAIPTGVKLNLRLVCKEERTYLYVEDTLAGEAQLYESYVETYGGSSFVVPAEKIGGGLSGKLYSLRITREETPRAAAGAVAADKSALKTALEQVMDVYAYSAATATAYERAAQMAQKVYDDASADQTKVDWAVRQLEETGEDLSLIHSLRHSREVCPHCGKSAEEIVWQPWTAKSAAYLTESGHYYLTGDTTVTTQVSIGAGSEGTEEQAVEIVLDLNGHRFTNTTARCFFVSPHCTFSLMDSVGSGSVSGGGKSDLSGGTMFVYTDGTFKLYGGNLTASGATAKNGGVVHVTAGTFEMYSGMIYGGQTLSEDTAAEGNGGNVCILSGGRFEMRGGTLAGGISTNKGGNVYLDTSSVMEFYDGLIIGGTSNTDVGGNIAVNAATFKMLGGTVQDGYAVNSGNIGCSGTAEIQIDGGLITGGVAKRYGGNIYINNANAQLNIGGGQINGDMRILAKVKLSGSPRINLGGSNGLQFVAGGPAADISDLEPDARIYVSRTGSSTFTTGYDAARHQNCFLGAVRSAVSVHSSGQLQIINGTTGYCPHCGKLVEWTAWTPVDGQTLSDSKHYYLTAAKTITSRIKIGEHLASENEVVIDFNGYNVSGATRFFYINSHLNLLDTNSKTSGYGAVTNSHATASGLIAQGRENATLNIYSGYYSVSSATASSVFYTLGATEVHGGVIDGSKIAKENNNGALNVSWGTLKMYGGRIIGGTTNKGGAVYYYGDNDKAFDLYGGVIMNGGAYGLGGNVYIGNEGVFNMRGGMILGGTGDQNDTNKNYNCDNVYVDDGRKANISGGYILGSDSSIKGNAITCWTNTDVTLSGDPRILNHRRAGNLYVGSTAALTVKEDFRGLVYANIQDYHLPTPLYGGVLTGSGAKTDGAEGAFAGELYLENRDKTPGIFGTEDGKLVVASVAVIREGNAMRWYRDADAATVEKTSADGAYIKLFAPQNRMTAAGTYAMDLNGKELAVTEGVSLYVKDSQTDDYTVEDGNGYGKITGDVSGMSAQSGYLLITEGEETSVHRLNLDTVGLNLRASAVGIYYSSQFGGDEVIKRNIASFGTALGAGNTPNFADKTYTRFAPDSWQPGLDSDGNSNNLSNGTLLVGIMNTGNGYSTNRYNADLKVYSCAYIELKNGERIMGDVVGYSLREVVEGTDGIAGVDAIWDTLTEEQKTPILEMFATYKTVMQGWNIPNIKAAAQ